MGGWKLASASCVAGPNPGRSLPKRVGSAEVGCASTSWGPLRAVMSTEGSQCQVCLGWTNPGSNPDSTTNQLCNPGQAT